MMHNKFKVGDIVLIIGIGKCNNKKYYKRKGKIICRDPYYKDYNIKLEDGTEDWFDKKYLFEAKENKNENIKCKNKRI